MFKSNFSALRHFFQPNFFYAHIRRLQIDRMGQKNQNEKKSGQMKGYISLSDRKIRRLDLLSRRFLVFIYSVFLK